MARYLFPAIFTSENDGVDVSFPDVEGCFTFGEDTADAMLMAEDALAMCLANRIVSYQDVPEASDEDAIKLTKNQVVHMVACDTAHYERKFNKKAVRKSLSIPEWVNDEALKLNINFSQTLLEALLVKIEAGKKGV